MRVTFGRFVVCLGGMTGFELDRTRSNFDTKFRVRDDSRELREDF